jgi:crotonobetainyl-CoA:carnitine CoA-transferase CaiB-like acyl-CoA transferase
MSPSAAPLEGVIVADFSRVLAGPLATMLLGDLGARVIKVERPDGGDETRGWAPPRAAGESTYFLSVNRNKRSIALDLADDGDLGLARELCLRADVVVENFRSDVMAGFGLGFADLEPHNPRLVYCSISGFGGGAGSDIPGYDLLVQAMSGLMSITGEPDGEPQKVGVALVDVIAGLYAAVGILGALAARTDTGGGQRIEVSLLDSILAGMVNQSSAFVNANVVPGRLGSAHPSIAPYQRLQTADDPLVVAVGNDRQFAALCSALGVGELASDSRFEHNEGRVDNRDALVAELERALAAEPAAVWVDRLGAVNVPCGPVNDIAGGFALAEELGLEPMREMVNAAGDLVRQVASPLRLSGTPVTYRDHPPALGEHDAELREWLSRPAG